jgi:hypothetical protein
MDTPSFEQKPIEADLKTLAAEINYGEAQKETEGTRLEGVEAVKNAIRAFPTLNKNEEPVAGGATATAIPASPVAASGESQLPAYAQTAAPEVKREIEFLLDVAMQQGISKALTESEKSPYFVQDAFHDALAGKLYPELQQRGLIK